MKQRILTAIIGLVIVIPILLIGSWPFIIFTYLLAMIALLELLKIKKKKTWIFPSVLAILFQWTILLYATDIPFSIEPNRILILFVMLLLVYIVLSKNAFSFTEAGFILIASLYVTFGFYFVLEARMEGLNYLLFILFVIWTTDTGAYFFGRAFGKTKLWPEISPNKTVAGAVGGVLLAAITTIVFQFVYPFSIGLLPILAVGISISIVGQVGDLVASAIKRHYNIKDFGYILPGHGGIMDRLDSLIFVLPYLHFIQFIA